MTESKLYEPVILSEELVLKLCLLAALKGWTNQYKRESQLCYELIPFTDISSGKDSS